MKGKSRSGDDMGNAIGQKPAAAARKPAAKATTGAAPSASGIADLKPHLPYSDLREWIAEAGKLGEVREVSGASWQQDIGMATELLSHEESAPVVLFKDIPGTLPGSRVLTGLLKLLCSN